MRKTKAQKQLDKDIETFYYRHGQNVEISVLDIPKVYRDGHAAAAAGSSVEDAVIAAIARYRRN